MLLALLHGRKTAGQRMNGKDGFVGPRLQGVTAVHFVYMDRIRVHFRSAALAAVARDLTGWESWDDNTLEIMRKDDLVRTVNAKGRSAYYGDWELVDAAEVEEA